MECLSRQLSEEVAKKGKKFGDRNSIVSAAHASPGESGGTNNTSYAEWQNIGSNVIGVIGTALLENMKATQGMRLVQSLDSPDRKMYAKEQLAL